MAEFQTQSETPNRLQPIFDLLASSGYIGDDESAFGKLCGGLSLCIASINSDNPQNDVVSCETLTHEDDTEQIVEALRLMKCPYAVEAGQIQNLDSESIIPVVQWLLDRVRTPQGGSKEDERKIDVVNQLQRLRERISMEGAETKVQLLVSHMQSLKSRIDCYKWSRLNIEKPLPDLERKESEFQKFSNARCFQLQNDVTDLKDKVENGCDSQNLSDGLNRSLSASAEELNSSRKELAAILRAVLAVRRQLDDVPSRSELIQYEKRFSELYVHIQGKHQQTQKYYDTYNALLEIKELMLKETSLLNSISSQFQDAITSTAGRMKLIDSMEGIVKGSRQKLEKVQHGLEEQEKICDALKERYTSEIAAQRQWCSLLKTFQEECAKNERLRSLTSV
ncbi:paramyosin-like protein [Parasponia andersonii]|uniref:Paramyosin-like protein n=1 Tax=Parasponia andersonii TaxID=3476 RepID=A0A2P5CA98_PARAD|nr:paramyosin-like protein [Parasponia andersonii]